MDCACGGTAMPQASCYPPNSLHVRMHLMVGQFALAARNAPGPDAYCDDESVSVPWPDPADPDWEPLYHPHKVTLPRPVEMRGQKRLLP